MEAMEEELGVGMRQAFADFMAHTLCYNCIRVLLKHCATLDKHFSNITIEFMFAGINMFWARLDSF